MCRSPAAALPCQSSPMHCPALRRDHHGDREAGRRPHVHEYSIVGIFFEAVSVFDVLVRSEHKFGCVGFVRRRVMADRPLLSRRELRALNGRLILRNESDS